MSSTIFTDATPAAPGTLVVSSWLNDVDTATYSSLTAIGGTADVITATGPVSMTAYAPGQRFVFIPTGTNTTNATININGLGGRAITKYGNTLTVAGDLVTGMTAEIVYDGAGFQLLNPRTINVSGIIPINNLTLPPVGQCYLTLSGANLILNRQNGKYLFINGAFREIPAAGVTLAPTGTVAGSAYNIYAFWTGSAIQLEASTTARATDTTWGHQIKSGDPTRTLVGKAYSNTGAVWVNTQAINGVISWFNRRHRQAVVATVAQVNVTALAPVELDAAGRVYFLSWGDESAIVHSGNNLQQQLTNVVTFGAAVLAGPSGSAIGASGYYQAYTNQTYGSVPSYVTGTPVENLGPGGPGLAICYGTQNVWLNAGGQANVFSGAQINVTFMG